jgi:hypothetical protein
MMDPSHAKATGWFENRYKEFRARKKKRQAAEKAKKKLKPEEVIEEEEVEEVYFIAFSGHGTASAECIPNNTMQT